MFGTYVYALYLSHIYVCMYVCIFKLAIFKRTVYFYIMSCLKLLIVLFNMESSMDIMNTF